MGYWRDTHFRIKGESVNDIQGRFILDWHQATKQPIELEQFCIVQKLILEQFLYKL